jgi:hypothetical protein
MECGKLVRMRETADQHTSLYRGLRFCLWLAAASLGCGPAGPAPVRLCSEGEVSDPEAPVLPMAPADGFSAVGYLTHDAGDAYGNPSCGATLVHPRVAVTAVHCLERALMTPGTRVGFGLGAICGRVISVTRLLPFTTQRDYDAPGKQHWDLAAIVLSQPVPGVTPAAIAAAQTGCTATHVGYGRKVAGDSRVREGYDGVRRSLAMCISATADGITATSPVGGSPCFGDSGSPLLDPSSGAVLGVLSGFVAPLAEVRCTPDEGVIYTSLSEHADFVRSVIADVEQGRY